MNPDLKWRIKPLEHYQEVESVKDRYRASHAQKDLAPTEEDVLQGGLLPETRFS